MGKGVLTHVELANEARHIIVFKVLWQNFLGKASLVKHMETGPSLKQRIVRNAELVNSVSDHISSREGTFTHLQDKTEPCSL